MNNNKHIQTSNLKKPIDSKGLNYYNFKKNLITIIKNKQIINNHYKIV